MPDSDESCRIIRPTSHTSALGLVFIAENGAEAQGEVARKGSLLSGFTRLTPPCDAASTVVHFQEHFGGGHGAAAHEAFSVSLGRDLEMRHSGLNQVEREWIVIRCVNAFVYLPAVYLNRAAHERPIYLSPRFEEATRWCGGDWRLA